LNSVLDNGTRDDAFCSQFTEQLIDDRRAFEELSFRELPHTVEEPWSLADGDAEMRIRARRRVRFADLDFTN